MNCLHARSMLIKIRMLFLPLPPKRNVDCYASYTNNNLQGIYTNPTTIYMYVCYICMYAIYVYILYMYMCACFFVRRFLTCLLFGFFVKNTKVYASRQWSMERGARGRWAGGNSQGSPPSESTVLCCCCCWTFRAISIKTVQMTKLWRAKCVCKVCVQSVCGNLMRHPDKSIAYT